jgi:uncharacterized membrane protein
MQVLITVLTVLCVVILMLLAYFAGYIRGRNGIEEER